MDQQLLDKVKTYDFGQSRLALTQLGDTITKAYGNEAETKQIESDLCGILESDAKFAGKQWVCRKLSIIGTPACVPALAKMLTDDKYADMARYALERIPGRESGMALARALGQTKGKTQIGIINTIGERGYAGSARGLTPLLSSSDADTVVAAAAALGKLGTADAAAALKTAAGKADGKVKMAILDSCLMCAEKLGAAGKTTEAMAIYTDLSGKGNPKLIQQAALRGRVNLLKKK